MGTLKDKSGIVKKMKKGNFILTGPVVPGPALSAPSCALWAFSSPWQGGMGAAKNNYL
jgi:hypothetical protein